MGEGRSIFSPRPASAEELGFSLATSGNMLLVGARGSNIAGPDFSGAVYAFERDDTGAWRHLGVLSASEAKTGDRFGHALAMTDGYAVVGALFGKSGATSTGSVDIFERQADGQWLQSTRLTPPEVQAFALFGAAVAIDGERLVVGAFLAGSGQEGEAYVYRKQGAGWDLEARLTPRDRKPNANFGISVAISGDTIVVGADGDDERGNAAGAAYVFSRLGGEWREQAKLLASDGDEGDFFGNPADIQRDVIVIGAHLNESSAGDASGSVYVFRRTESTWSEEARLVPGDVAAGDGFGVSVSVADDVIAAGAYQDNGGGRHAGSVYVFHHDGEAWKEVAELHREGAAADDELGAAVDVSHSGFIAAGAPKASAVVSMAGAVHLTTYERKCVCAAAAVTQLGSGSRSTQCHSNSAPAGIDRKN